MKIKAQKLLQNSNIRSASGSIIAYGFGAVLLALSGFVLARVLGPEGMGTYDFAEAWVEVLLPIAVLGLDRVLIRQIPVYLSQNRHELLLGIWRYARKQANILSIVFTISLSLLFFLWFGTLESNQSVLYSTLLAVVLLVIRVRIRLYQATLQGLRYVARSLLPDFIIRPLLFMIFFLIYYLFKGEIAPQTAVFLHVIGTIIALIVGMILIRRLLPDTMKTGEIKEDSANWLRQSIQFAIIVGLTLATIRVSTILLGTFSTFEETGFYGIALRITTLVILPQLAITSFIQPRVAQLYSEKKTAEMQRLLVLSIRATVILALLFIIPVLIAAPYVLELFGEGYAPALPVLYILTIGQFVSLIVGPVAPILMMTDCEYELIIITIISLIIITVLNLLLIPTQGAVGASIATTIGLVINNTGQFAVVRWRLGVWALPFAPKSPETS